MKKKEASGLRTILHAEMQRSIWLFAMQVDIEASDFEGAMRTQLEYLSWHDEFIELLDKHHNEWWELKLAVLGVEW